MNKTDIEWCDYTWNPITGCRRGCSYCYARRIHERFYKTPFRNIVFHRERLADKMPKWPSRIFVGSMSDCQYWNINEFYQVLEVCNKNRQHTFMFLSKSEYSYKGIYFPDNCMQGVTVTMEGRRGANIMEILPRPFLSIEPLLGNLEIRVDESLELVIVGAMTGPGATPPKPEWVQSVKDNVPADKIFWKNNIRKYL